MKGSDKILLVAQSSHILVSNIIVNPVIFLPVCPNNLFVKHCDRGKSCSENMYHTVMLVKALTWTMIPNSLTCYDVTVKPYISSDDTKKQLLITAYTEILHYVMSCTIQLQNDVDDSEVDDEHVSDEQDVEDKEPNKFSPAAVAVVVIALVVCVIAFVGAMWWMYGNGHQCPSILRGYEPVLGSDSNTLTDDFLISTDVP